MLPPANLIRNLPQRSTALITGATSGIGKAFAQYFASIGYDLIITGRRKEMITQVASEIIAEFGVNVIVIIADLSLREDLLRLMKEVDNCRFVEVLVNNAGYGMDCRFSEDYLDHQLSMLEVHVNAPLRLIHKVLPAMMEKRRGTIINVSSLSAYMPTAGNGMYASTKSFLRNFTESLHMDVSGYGIKVQCLCPGFTYSEFHRKSDITPAVTGLIPWMKPSEVVDYSISSLIKGQVICIPGFTNRVFALASRFIPRNLYYQLAIWQEQRIRKRRHSQELAGEIQGGRLYYLIANKMDRKVPRSGQNTHAV